MPKQTCKKDAQTDRIKHIIIINDRIKIIFLETVCAFIQINHTQRFLTFYIRMEVVKGRYSVCLISFVLLELDLMTLRTILHQIFYF